MKVCAVICEFNPFHNGHKYLLEQAKLRSGCDVILCVMSGNFTQRAEPAIIDKASRTELALKNGADFVIELPVSFSTMNGSVFAKGAINIISQLNHVTHLAFGCECGQLKPLTDIADIQANESKEFKCELKKLLNDGLPYPSAYAKATTKMVKSQKCNENDSSMCDIILSKPNNLLAIEYIKQIYLQNINITPIAIERIGADFNDTEIKENYSSASALREKIERKEFNFLENNVPANCIKKIVNISDSNPIDKTIYSAFIIEALRRKNLEGLYDSGEGLEVKLKKNAMQYNCLDEIILATKSKRYTLARIKRLCLQALFDIKKDSYIFQASVPLKLLGIRKEHKDKIGKLSSSLIIQNKDYSIFFGIAFNEYLQIEKHAASIYGVITSNSDNFYSSKLVEV